MAAQILSYPDYTKDFVIHTDASGHGIGAELLQNNVERDNVICYLSLPSTKQEVLYTTSKRKILALVWTLQELRPYIDRMSVSCTTDHYSLRRILNLNDTPPGSLSG